jgi:hypothetical protein
MRRDADDRTDVNALSGKRVPRRARSSSRAASTPGPAREAPSSKKRARTVDPTDAPEGARIELVTERQGVLGYRYRRLTIEQQGKRAQVREFRLQLDYDLQFELATKKRDLIKVRGRRLESREFSALWTALSKLRPLRLSDRYEHLDSLKPEDLDETVGADGEPIAVSTGEEGPACITISWAESAATGNHLRKRIVIERFREPAPEAAAPRNAKRAPLAALCALVDSRLKVGRALNYRRVDPFVALAEEFSSLRDRHFVNLRQLERRIVEAFGALKNGKAIPLLESELFAADSRVRLGALDALGAIGDDAAVSAVEDLIYDDETSVREKARRILKGLKSAR